jgi:hypothetical protein
MHTRRHRARRQSAWWDERVSPGCGAVGRSSDSGPSRLALEEVTLELELDPRPKWAGHRVEGKDAAPAVHGDVGSSIRHFIADAEVVVRPGDV